MVFLFLSGNNFTMSNSNNLIRAIKEKGKNIEAEMSFFDHIEVLRWHIIRSVIAIAVFAILSFTFYDFVFNQIIMGPKNLDFWTYRMMCKVGDLLNLEGFCVERIPFNIINTELDRKSTRLNSSHVKISYAVFCLKKKITMQHIPMISIS